MGKLYSKKDVLLCVKSELDGKYYPLACPNCKKEIPVTQAKYYMFYFRHSRCVKQIKDGLA